MKPEQHHAPADVGVKEMEASPRLQKIVGEVDPHVAKAFEAGARRRMAAGEYVPAKVEEEIKRRDAASQTPAIVAELTREEAGYAPEVPTLKAGAGMASGSTRGLYMIPIEWIMESEHNQRKTFDTSKLIGLGASMRSKGQIVAAKVFWMATSPSAMQYELNDGARRYRAAKLVGLKYLKCEIASRPIEKVDELKSQIIANLQRDDWNPLEQAAAWRELKAQGGYSSIEAMASDMGFAASARSIRDLIEVDERASEPVRKALAAGEITKSHAVLIARGVVDGDADKQKKYLEKCFDYNKQLVSEKSLRDLIKNEKEQARWKAQRAAELKKSKAAAKLAKASPDKVAKEKARQAEAEAKRKADEEKAKAAELKKLNDKLAALVSILPAEIPRVLLVQAAASANHDSRGGRLVEAQFGMPLKPERPSNDGDWKAFHRAREAQEAERDKRIEAMSRTVLSQFISAHKIMELLGHEWNEENRKHGAELLAAVKAEVAGGGVNANEPG